MQLERRKFGALISTISSWMGGRTLTMDQVDKLDELTTIDTYPETQYTQLNWSLYLQSRTLAKEGKKIDAIKALRSSFNPTLPLKEAKDIVEQW